MKNYFKFLKSDTIMYWSYLLSLLLLGFIGIIVGIFFRFLPPFLPLYNKLPWGYSRVGEKIEILIPIALTVIIVVGNSFFGKFIYGKAILLSRILAAISLLTTIILTIYIIQIILLVH